MQMVVQLSPSSLRVLAGEAELLGGQLEHAIDVSGSTWLIGQFGLNGVDWLPDLWTTGIAAACGWQPNFSFDAGHVTCLT